MLRNSLNSKIATEFVNMKGLKFKPLTEYNWNDLEVLFGEKGALAVAGVCIGGYLRASTTKEKETKTNRL